MLEYLFSGLASWGPDFLRLSLGPTMIIHGYPKLFGPRLGPAGFSQHLQRLGFSPPLFWAYAVGCAEFFGGICLLAGFLTRLAALILAIEFTVITFRIKWSEGFELAKGGWEWDWALLVMLLSVLVTGPGRIALDHRIPTGL